MRLNTYIMCALFPLAVGTGGDGLISDPPKNCIVCFGFGDRSWEERSEGAMWETKQVHFFLLIGLFNGPFINVPWNSGLIVGWSLFVYWLWICVLSFSLSWPFSLSSFLFEREWNHLIPHIFHFWKNIMMLNVLINTHIINSMTIK